MTEKKAKRTTKTHLLCKYIALMLVVVLLTATVSGCGFFPSYKQKTSKYANKNFNDMKYSRIDDSEFNMLADEIKDLSSKAFKAGTIVDKYARMLEIYSDAYSMYAICNINNNIDVTDQYYIDELAYTADLIFKMENTIEDVTKVLYESKNKTLVELYLGEELWEYYLPDHVPENIEEVTKLINREQELVSEYNIVSAKEYKTEYNGKLYTIDELEELTSEIDSDKYYELLLDIAKQMNAEAGELYLELVDVRNQIAEAYGYDSYAEYTYDEYYRDYTPEEALALSENVKKYISDVYSQLALSLDFKVLEEADKKFEDMTSDELVKLSKETAEKIYPDMKESFEFMKKNNLLNVGNDKNRMDTSFVTMLYGYEVPFLFSTTHGDVLDFQGIMHEFGHFNAYKKYPTAANSGLDTLEVHSQGMEVMSWVYYDDIFGAENSDEICKYMMALLCDAIVSGCMYDEFQQRVYALENPTLSDINKIYYELCLDYNVDVYDNGTGEAYMWVDILHNFVAPFYYVSYATSAMVALELWTVQLENPDKALNQYLDFVKNSSELTKFGEVVETTGLSSPFDDDTAKKIAGELKDYIKDNNKQKDAA